MSPLCNSFGMHLAASLPTVDWQLPDLHFGVQTQRVAGFADRFGTLQVRKAILKEVALQLRPELEAIVAAQDAQLQGEYSPDSKSAARRYAIVLFCVLFGCRQFYWERSVLCTGYALPAALCQSLMPLWALHMAQSYSL